MNIEKQWNHWDSVLFQPPHLVVQAHSYCSLKYTSTSPPPYCGEDELFMPCYARKSSRDHFAVAIATLLVVALGLDARELCRSLADRAALFEKLRAHLAPFREALYREHLSHIQETDETAPAPRADGYEYFSKTVEGKSYRLYCRRPRGLSLIHISEPTRLLSM